MITLPIAIMVMPEGDDRDYMEQLYRAHYRLMFATAWKYYNDKSIVDDIVSDSCISLFKNISTLQGLNEEQRKAYIVTAVRNTAINCSNKQNRANQVIFANGEQMLEYVADDIDVEKKIALKDELNFVWKVIRQLPEKEQQIMYLKYAMELSDAEIAERVGLSENSIRKYISRAREHIKKIVYVD